ncbi:MAG: hypothetical protein EXQ74_06895 [Thermoleophilia bacterium]|nr:hypothetical protein [Thermoleophilia bacterium]
MSAPEITSAILAADRRVGARVRAQVDRMPGGHETARFVAHALAPSFHGVVLVLVILPGTRMLGVRAGIAGALAGITARTARDGIDRPRPGRRREGGFPSRHAASATAISIVIAREKPVLGAAAALTTGVGLLARVASADHDPLDIAAGVGLGAAVARLTRRRRRQP